MVNLMGLMATDGREGLGYVNDNAICIYRKQTQLHDHQPAFVFMQSPHC